jgi:hypothetical protein
MRQTVWTFTPTGWGVLLGLALLTGVGLLPGVVAWLGYGLALGAAVGLVLLLLVLVGTLLDRRV